MILNDTILKILSQFNSVTNNVIMSYPITSMRENQNIHVFIDIQKLGSEEFKEFGIFGLSDFISAVNMIPDFDIELNDKVLEIFNSKSSVKFNTANVSLLEETCRGDYELLQRIKKNSTIAEFDISNDDMKSLKQACSVLKNLPFLEIFSEEDSIVLKVCGLEKSTNSYSLCVDGDKKEDFKIQINTASFKRIPNGNFRFKIFKSNKGSYILLLESKDVESLEIIMSVKV